MRLEESYQGRRGLARLEEAWSKAEKGRRGWSGATKVCLNLERGLKKREKLEERN